MTKYLHVTMSDGITWEIPAALIAKARARYFAESDPLTTYEKELAYVLSDNFELLDWAANNMDWEDVAHAARALPQPATQADYHREWTNADREIVES